MGFDFNFRSLDSEDIPRVIDFIHARPFNYPGYDDWVEQTRLQLYVHEKKAILAFSDGRLVGNLIFQQHRGISSLLEMKNLRVEQILARRGFAEFMIRQVEQIAREGNYAGIITDIRSENLAMVWLLMMRNYREIARTPIYGDDTEDLVFVKAVRAEESRIWMPSDLFIMDKLRQ